MQEGMVGLECSMCQDLRIWRVGKSHQEEQWGQERLVKEVVAGAGPRAGVSCWWNKVEVEEHVMVG